MRRIDRIIREARDSCETAGHDMGPFYRDKKPGRIEANSYCRACGQHAKVIPYPYPDEATIIGAATIEWISCEQWQEHNRKART
jgi:hypothetical protein